MAVTRHLILNVCGISEIAPPPSTAFPTARRRGDARGDARGARFGFGEKFNSVHVGPFRISFATGGLLHAQHRHANTWERKSKTGPIP